MDTPHDSTERLSDNAAQQPDVPLLRQLLRRELSTLWRTPNGQWQQQPAEHPVGLLSGAFNPLHAGHVELRRVAQRLLGGPVHFELPVLNADKPPLQKNELLQRAGQFDGEHLAVSIAATFLEKSRLFPGTTFVLGIDTARRLLEPRFYGGKTARFHRAFEEIRAAGCEFLVAGRLLDDRFCTLSELAIPVSFRDLFREIPAALFRVDLCSTILRRAKMRDRRFL